MAETDDLLTIDALTAAVNRALEASPPGEVSGRVRALPEVRTLRYYTTVGLIDRPARLEGRTALYSRRHFLQLVCIKRLQARGFSLAEIQLRLLNAGDAQLEKLAELPPKFDWRQAPAANRQRARPAPEAAAAAARQTKQREPDRVFWKTRPTAASATVPHASAPHAAKGPAPAVLLGVPLDAASSLLISATRPLNEEDFAAIRNAARPLLEVLHQRRLLS